MLNDFEDVNRILAEMSDEGMIEPIDENTCHPMDWAEVVGVADEIFDEVYPEPMVDKSGILWYVH